MTQPADRRLGRIRSIIGMQSSPRLVEARSQMVDSFLTLRNEWLLMIDADMAWSPDDFELIAKHADPDDVPILGGLCFGRGRCHGIAETDIQLHVAAGAVEVRPQGDTQSRIRGLQANLLHFDRGCVVRDSVWSSYRAQLANGIGQTIRSRFAGAEQVRIARRPVGCVNPHGEQQRPFEEEVVSVAGYG